ncbi:MAG: protein translocase SEC61 complex subunit gamma [Candidatus Micrarchaeota archaeon]|nr:protein translocase SEC61 complex subunit gamma [Candidatus Micrarchaeota archaeon]
MNLDIAGSFRKFIGNSKHVMSVSYKPNRDEFNKAAKLIIFGILLIGAMGFVLALAISIIITGSLSLI